MSAFFSGTDMSELEDNSENHNIYVSLIVNNLMNNVAKVAFRGSTSIESNNIPYLTKDENGQEYTLYVTPDKNLEENVLFMYDLDISYESYEIEDSFISRYKEIENKSRVIAPKFRAKKFKDHFNTRSNVGRQQSFWEPEQSTMHLPLINNEDDIFSSTSVEDLDKPTQKIFASFLVNNKYVPQSVESAIEATSKNKNLYLSLLEDIPQAFNKAYYSVVKTKDTEDYLEVLWDCIIVLSELVLYLECEHLEVLLDPLTSLHNMVEENFMKNKKDIADV